MPEYPVQNVMFNGFQIMENATLTISESIPRFKPWWQKVIEWNPCNTDFIKSNFIETTKPDPSIYKVGNKIMAHPSIVRQMKEALT